MNFETVCMVFRNAFKNHRKVKLMILIIVVAWMSLTSFEPSYDSFARERYLIMGGKFEVVARTTGILLSVMPGQSGDSSGKITIYELPSKKSCGTAPVNFVGNFTLDWEPETRTATVGRPVTALWDLEKCSVRFHNLYPNL